MMTIDLNCDLGEGMPSDAEIMPYISSANIACGYHAGDKDTMSRTIKLCLQNNVAIGAHPGFKDKENFGRINQQLSAEGLYDLVHQQLFILNEHCKEAGTALHHVKPHGALYNLAAKDRALSKIIVKAVSDFNPDLIFYGLAGSVMIEEARAANLKTANEVFADRTYQRDGSLTPRNENNALIQDTQEALAQVMQMVKCNTVNTVQGEVIDIYPQTICIHGDGVHAADLARAIHQLLRANSISINPPRV